MVFTKNKKGEGYIEICILVVGCCIILSVMISFVTAVGVIRQTKRNSRVVLDSFVMKNSVAIYDSVKQGEDTVYELDAEQYISELCSFCCAVSKASIAVSSSSGDSLPNFMMPSMLYLPRMLLLRTPKTRRMMPHISAR